MKVAIVGSGISGLVAAHMLHRHCDLTIYEAASWIGGHTHTVDVQACGRSWAIDTGFIVFNERTYPSFTRLLAELGVVTQPSTMGFSVHCAASGLEYSADSLAGLFVRRRNLLRADHWRMIADILRFNRKLVRHLDGAEERLTLGEMLRGGGYSPAFIDGFLVPMAAAIWSANPRSVLDFPARSFLRFFHNHGFLDLRDRPQWRVVSGGSREYVRRLTAPFLDRIRLATPVASIRRRPECVAVTTRSGATADYDRVIIATHSDQALALLADPSPVESDVLGAIPYQPNEVVLHSDTRLLPRARKAWAAWNVHVPAEERDAVTMTYHMNQLQSLDAPVEFLVTLNQSAAIDPALVLARLRYEHPLYTCAAPAAQRRQDELNGHNRTYFCGAYWGHGFHEDGVRSALGVARHFGVDRLGATA